jgi:hypothetical protein
MENAISPVNNIIPVSDLPGVAIAGAALAVSAMLLVIGIRISSEFHGLSRRVAVIELGKDENVRRVNSVRTVIEVLRSVSESQMGILNSICQLILASDGGDLFEVSDPGFRINVLREDMARYTGTMVRYLKYLEFLRMSYSSPNREYAEIQLMTICDVYKDELSIAYLEAILPLLSGDMLDMTQRSLSKLRLSVRGVVSVLWSGGS